MELLFADRAPCNAGGHILNSLKKHFDCHMAILPEAATVSPLYFGQPLTGFFFASDFLTASCRVPSTNLVMAGPDYCCQPFSASSVPADDRMEGQIITPIPS